LPPLYGLRCTRFVPRYLRIPHTPPSPFFGHSHRFVPSDLRSGSPPTDGLTPCYRLHHHTPLRTPLLPPAPRHRTVWFDISVPDALVTGFLPTTQDVALVVLVVGHQVEPVFPHRWDRLPRFRERCLNVDAFTPHQRTTAVHGPRAGCKRFGADWWTERRSDGFSLPTCIPHDEHTARHRRRLRFPFTTGYTYRAPTLPRLRYATPHAAYAAAYDARTLTTPPTYAAHAAGLGTMPHTLFSTRSHLLVCPTYLELATDVTTFPFHTLPPYAPTPHYSCPGCIDAARCLSPGSVFSCLPFYPQDFPVSGGPCLFTAVGYRLC